MKKIYLSKGKFALVDDEDYDFLIQWKWHISQSGYAVRTDNRLKKTTMMHREVNKTLKNLETDHIDGNKINNQKNNLRSALKVQNQGNRKPQKGTSKFKGVCWNKENKNWRAGIRVNKKSKCLGSFKNEADAARAYNIAAKEYFGDFAKVNEGV